MRKFVALATVCVLAACGGGGGTGSTGGALPQATPTATPTTQPGSSGNQPQFSIAFPANRTSVKGGKHAAFVSSGAASIVINRTAPSALSGTPQAISAATCTVPTPCTVYGPAWQTGVSNTYVLTTYDVSNGTGNALDTATITFIPTPGQTSQAVTLNGIPASATIAGVPTTWNADTQGYTQSLTVTAKDADGEVITGTYGAPIDMYAGDTKSYGASLSGTHNNGSCVKPFIRHRDSAISGTCVQLTNDSDTVTLNYDGLAEQPVSLGAGVSGTSIGSATFTPVLQAITVDTSISSTNSAGGYGVDLFTADSSSTSGYSGSVYFSEPGFTDSPYSQTLATVANAACDPFASIASGVSNANDTEFDVTAIASPVAGSCTVTVTDNLSDQPNTLPTFTVTYTTFSGGTINAKPGHQKP